MHEIDGKYSQTFSSNVKGRNEYHKASKWSTVNDRARKRAIISLGVDFMQFVPMVRCAGLNVRWNLYSESQCGFFDCSQVFGQSLDVFLFLLISQVELYLFNPVYNVLNEKPDDADMFAVKTMIVFSLDSSNTVQDGLKQNIFSYRGVNECEKE